KRGEQQPRPLIGRHFEAVAACGGVSRKDDRTDHAGQAARRQRRPFRQREFHDGPVEAPDDRCREQEEQAPRVDARRRALVDRLGHDRTASATLATTQISAAIWYGPSGSCSHAAEIKTPPTGTTMVEIAATDAGKRCSAASQQT